jgi:hypothetical protein
MAGETGEQIGGHMAKKAKTGINKAVEAVKRKVGRPKKGEEMPRKRVQARECSNPKCGAVEQFAKTRGPMITKTLRIDWMRCTVCNHRTRFETPLK